MFRRARARVGAGLEIHFVADPAVAGQSEHILRERIVDQRRCRGRLRDFGVGERESPTPEACSTGPGRSGCCSATGRRSNPRRTDGGRDRAQIEIVPGEVPVDPFVGDLGEPAQMLADASGDEQCRFVERQIVVATEVLGAGTWSLRVWVNDVTAIAATGIAACDAVYSRRA